MNKIKFDPLSQWITLEKSAFSVHCKSKKCIYNYLLHMWIKEKTGRTLLNSLYCKYVYRWLK